MVTKERNCPYPMSQLIISRTSQLVVRLFNKFHYLQTNRIILNKLNCRSPTKVWINNPCCVPRPHPSWAPCKLLSVAAVDQRLCDGMGSLWRGKQENNFTEAYIHRVHYKSLRKTSFQSINQSAT